MFYGLNSYVLLGRCLFFVYREHHDSGQISHRLINFLLPLVDETRRSWAMLTYLSIAVLLVLVALHGR